MPYVFIWVFHYSWGLPETPFGTSSGNSSKAGGESWRSFSSSNFKGISKFIFDVIGQINQSGTTIFLIEQNVRTALELGRGAYVIENGRIVKKGECRDMLDDPHIREAYLGTESV